MWSGLMKRHSISHTVFKTYRKLTLKLIIFHLSLWCLVTLSMIHTYVVPQVVVGNYFRRGKFFSWDWPGD